MTSMNYVNPYFFAAVLENVSHRFVLVQECESVLGTEGFAPPRFSVGAVNATRDPRWSSVKQLMEVGVTESALEIPKSWLMCHQYIYVVHENTDEFGWQYRSAWPLYGPPGPKEEQWSNTLQPNSQVRRRIWMTTIVPRFDLVRAKRLLSENIRIDRGSIKLQGELMRYEKGTLTKSWQKRKCVLYHNRIEFYSGVVKKGEVSLQDCEVKMLFEHQNPGGKNAFSIRNPSGSVGVLLDADNKETRRAWVLAIQYQISINSHEMNFVPLEYSPPTGLYPDNRVMVSGDLKLLGKDGSSSFPRNFQLRPREMIYFEGDELKGRIFVEQANVSGEDRNLNFAITSASGITLNLSADNPESKTLWLMGVRRQVQSIENYKMKAKTAPKEELNDDGIPVIDRISQFYDESWTAPAVAGEDEDYLENVFKAPYQNNPAHFEFSEELGINLDPSVNARPPSPPPAPAPAVVQEVVVEPVKTPEQAPPPRTLPHLKSTKSFLNVFQPSVKLLDPKRNLINPRFMLSALKGVTHRFVLVLECENRVSASRAIQDAAPPRFSVGGARASKDPRTVKRDQLIGISNKNPEVQLPSGWFMLHQYIYIVQQNTDDDGWQYRSTWSDGTPSTSEEQWGDTCDADKYVRRRLWMTTVVKRDDILKAKKMVYDELSKSGEDAIMQEVLYLYNPEMASTASSWQRRKVLLFHNKLEFYSGNDKTGEANLIDCEVKILTGKDRMGRDYPFSITHPSGSVKVLLDADSREMRLRWVRAILYQLCIISPDLSFGQFLFGPPTGELNETRIMLCGELEILQNTENKWETYQIQLHEKALLCYNRDALRGKLLLDHALVKARDDETEFSLKTLTGLTVHFKASSPEVKFAWIRALKRQIQMLEYLRNKPPSPDDLAVRSKLKQYYDPDWTAVEGEFREDDDHMQGVRKTYEGNLKQFWPIDYAIVETTPAPLQLSKSIKTVKEVSVSSASTEVTPMVRLPEVQAMDMKSDITTSTDMVSTKSFATEGSTTTEAIFESKTATAKESKSVTIASNEGGASKTVHAEMNVNKFMNVTNSVTQSTTNNVVVNNMTMNNVMEQHTASNKIIENKFASQSVNNFMKNTDSVSSVSTDSQSNTFFASKQESRTVEEKKFMSTFSSTTSSSSVSTTNVSTTNISTSNTMNIDSKFNVKNISLPANIALPPNIALASNSNTTTPNPVNTVPLPPQIMSPPKESPEITPFPPAGSGSKRPSSVRFKEYHDAIIIPAIDSASPTPKEQSPNNGSSNAFFDIDEDVQMVVEEDSDDEAVEVKEEKEEVIVENEQKVEDVVEVKEETVEEVKEEKVEEDKEEKVEEVVEVKEDKVELVAIDNIAANNVVNNFTSNNVLTNNVVANNVVTNNIVTNNVITSNIVKSVVTNTIVTNTVVENVKVENVKIENISAKNESMTIAQESSNVDDKKTSPIKNFVAEEPLELLPVNAEVPTENKTLKASPMKEEIIEEFSFSPKTKESPITNEDSTPRTRRNFTLLEKEKKPQPEQVHLKHGHSRHHVFERDVAAETYVQDAVSHHVPVSQVSEGVIAIETAPSNDSDEDAYNVPTEKLELLNVDSGVTTTSKVSPIEDKDNEESKSPLNKPSSVGSVSKLRESFLQNSKQSSSSNVNNDSKPDLSKSGSVSKLRESFLKQGSSKDVTNTTASDAKDAKLEKTSSVSKLRDAFNRKESEKDVKVEVNKLSPVPVPPPSMQSPSQNTPGKLSESRMASFRGNTTTNVSTPKETKENSPIYKTPIMTRKESMMSLSDMNAEYLQSKGYINSEGTMATIPLQDLKQEDRELMVENGYVDSTGLRAVIPMKSKEQQEEDRQHYLEMINKTPSEMVQLRHVDEEVILKEKGLNRVESQSALPSVQLRHVERESNTPSQQRDSTRFEWSPLQLVKLRRVNVNKRDELHQIDTESPEKQVNIPLSNVSSPEEVSSPFKMVKLKSVARRFSENTMEIEEANKPSEAVSALKSRTESHDNSDVTPIDSLEDLQKRSMTRKASIKDTISKFETGNKKASFTSPK